MNKYLVSTLVIISFIVYSVFQRSPGSQAIPAVGPKNNSMGNNPSGSTQTNSNSTPAPTSVQSQLLQSDSNTPTSTQAPTSVYKDGTYIGDTADAFYGNIQVQATISNGRITDIQFLQYPNDRGTSIAINRQADPMLAQEAIQAQSANVDVVSGATDSSQAFIQSLQSALNKARGS